MEMINGLTDSTAVDTLATEIIKGTKDQGGPIALVLLGVIALMGAAAVWGIRMYRQDARRREEKEEKRREEEKKDREKREKEKGEAFKELRDDVKDGIAGIERAVTDLDKHVTNRINDLDKHVTTKLNEFDIRVSNKFNDFDKRVTILESRHNGNGNGG